MTRVLVASALVLLTAAPAFAQMGGGAPQKIGIAQGLTRAYDGVKRNLTEMAANMPEADYGYKPHQDSRTFGQLFAHAATSMYGSCSAVRGVANPNPGKNLEQDLKTKAEFVKALAESFAFCDEAVKGMTDANAVEFVKQGQNEVARASIIAGVTSHNNEMYGTGAAYMRAKGLVPPSTERQQQMRRPGL
ncbi:MAG: DinB family protein [Acidobacteria bacterium]|nr:DinB family protein [Acidobacteriota bacterium]